MVARDIELATVKVRFQRETGEFELPASVSAEILDNDVERDASGRHSTQVRLSQEDSARPAWMQLRRHNQTMQRRRRCTRCDGGRTTPEFGSRSEFANFERRDRLLTYMSELPDSSSYMAKTWLQLRPRAIVVKEEREWHATEAKLRNGFLDSPAALDPDRSTSPGNKLSFDHESMRH